MNTTKAAQLAEKIEHLKAEAEFENLLTPLLEGYDFRSYVKEWLGKTEKRAWITALNIEQVCDLLTRLEPSNESYELGSDRVTVMNVPYRIDLENPTIGSRLAEISYQTNGFSFSIKFPEAIIENFLTFTNRKLYDTQYHYFTGLSMGELRNMKLRKANFKAPQINWYGGSVTLRCNEEVMAIINYLKGE